MLFRSPAGVRTDVEYALGRDLFERGTDEIVFLPACVFGVGTQLVVLRPLRACLGPAVFADLFPKGVGCVTQQVLCFFLRQFARWLGGLGPLSWRPSALEPPQQVGQRYGCEEGRKEGRG